VIVDDDLVRLQALERRQREELDRAARRSFSLYAAAATFNGYSYQAHLLKSKEIPRYRAQRELIQQHLSTFEAEVADEQKLKRFLGKWQWRNEAERVGMQQHYDYLYRLSSRLLHATPMNVITEKDLSESERIVLLEYIVVATLDALDAIDAFDFPGLPATAVVRFPLQ
jgi:hypothetical protein